MYASVGEAAMGFQLPFTHCQLPMLGLRQSYMPLRLSQLSMKADFTEPGRSIVR
jgi:hypothetical protein